MDELYDDCYEIYKNDIKILNNNPKSIVDQANPQRIFDEMKQKSLSMVGFQFSMAYNVYVD